MPSLGEKLEVSLSAMWVLHWRSVVLQGLVGWSGQRHVSIALDNWRSVVLLGPVGWSGHAQFTSFHILSTLLAFFSVYLSYFILAVPMRKCWAHHSCMSSTFKCWAHHSCMSSTFNADINGYVGILVVFVKWDDSWSGRRYFPFTN